MAVKDMPKMKEFVQKIGFKIVTEYRQDDEHWWTGIKLADDSLVITLSTFTAGKLGVPGLYVLAPDIEAAHADLTAKGLNPGAITPDLYGPGSGVKWFMVTDPDGNMWQIAQAKSQWMP